MSKNNLKFLEALEKIKIISIRFNEVINELEDFQKYKYKVYPTDYETN